MLALGVALATAVLVGGCSGDGEVVLLGGQKVPAEDIDRDALALLPAGVVLLGHLDARSLFATSLGPDVAKLVSSLLPLGPESNFVPSRDVVGMYGGAYTMQGADFCVVIQGTFDADAIHRSADARAMTVAGMPLVKSRYADLDVYTAGNVGFVVLTSHTVLSGNETGMRRALDRLRFGKLERSVPSWMIDLLATPNATVALAGDLRSQPGIDASKGQLPFVAGLSYVRVLGNFQPPGLNFAGAFTYADPASAQAGTAALQNLNQLTQFMSLLSSLGFGVSIPPLRLAQSGNDVAFTVALDDRLVRVALARMADAIRPPPGR